MGHAARINNARRVKALQDGTLTDRPDGPGILDRMRPAPMPPAIVSLRLAAMLAIAHGVSARPARRGTGRENKSREVTIPY